MGVRVRGGLRHATLAERISAGAPFMLGVEDGPANGMAN